MKMSTRPFQSLPPIRIIQDPSDRPVNPHSSLHFRSPHFTNTWRVSDSRMGDELSRILQAPGSSTKFASGVDLTHDNKFRENLSWEKPTYARPENQNSQLSETSHEMSSSAVLSAVESPLPTPSPSARFDEVHGSIGSQCGTFFLERTTDPKVASSSEAYCSRFQFHDKYRTMSLAYDKEILSKLDVRRKNSTITPPQVPAKPHFGLSPSEASPSQVSLELHSRLERLSVPVSSPSCKITRIESLSSQWPETLLSPSSSNFYSGQVDRKSPIDVIDSGRLSVSPNFNRLSNGYFFGNEFLGLPCSPHDGSDQRMPLGNDDDFRNEARLRRLKIDDLNIQPDLLTSSALGKKRKASSSPQDNTRSPHISTSPNELHQRRESTASRSSVGPRFHSQSGSISSTGSGSRINSYASNLSLTPSSITSIGSVGRHSPACNSPGDFESIDSPCAISLSSNSSPQGPRTKNCHLEKKLSENRTFFVPVRYPNPDRSQPNGGLLSALQGVFVCDCCPKKPRRFETQEKLHAHEQEKQYECLYCRNRFKNKNEAERHQNSLHLRRHSWSCAALTEYAAAFHSSSTQPNESDTCGYCGENFPRSGYSSGRSFATEKDWDARINHLTEIHKFGECNHTKKFFRADHFRQHLKHSHAGTSGKWTNKLENACIKDEPFPEPIRRPDRISPGGPLVN